MKIKFILISVLLTLNLCSCQNKEKKSGIDIRESGLPDIEKEWTNADLQKTFDVLQGLKKMDTFSLPRLKDEKTSDIFKKIMSSIPKVNPQDTLNLFDQFDNYGRLIRALPNLLGLYGGASESEHKFYSNEAIEILKRVLIDATNSSQLLFEHYLDGKEESKEALDRVKRHNGGAVKMFSGSLNMIDPSNKYRLEDKLEIANTASDNLKKIWKYLGAENRTELMDKVTYFSRESDSPEIREVLSKLAADLSKK